jgi:molybdopterin-containing oxidoreductase family iron-sulfur binding subunit
MKTSDSKVSAQANAREARVKADRPAAANTPDSNPRRKFIAAAGAGVAGLGFTAIAPGLHLMAVGEASAATEARKAGTAASPAVRWGLLIDATKCAPGCTKCIDACHTENGVSEKLPDARQNSQWIRKIELVDRRNGKKTELPMMCQHCAEPPCVDVCPTGASMKRADGIVLVDRHTCIGCRYCMMACPYKARSFVHAPLTEQNPEVPRGQGCVESCTLCVHRVDKGQTPACVESCPEGAMLFGDLNDPSSAIARRIASVPTTQVRADLRLNPGVRYQGI